MNLYWINGYQYSSPYGIYVVAETPEDAIRLWRQKTTTRTGTDVGELKLVGINVPVDGIS